MINTPGPNNSMDKNHEVAMESAIKKSNYKKVFYLLNASQLGTEDDNNDCYISSREIAVKKMYCLLLISQM